MARASRVMLLEAIRSVLPGVSSNGVIEQADCVVFHKGHACSYNDEVTCRARLPESLEGLSGAVKADPLVRLLSKLPDEEVDVETTGSELLIKSKGRRAGFPLVTEVLLPVGDLQLPKEWHEVPENFSEALGLVAGCVRRDESIFALACVHMTSEFMEASDNYQMARYRMDLPFKDVLLHGPAARSVAGWKVVAVGITEQWIWFRSEQSTELGARLYVDKYPDFDRVVNEEGRVLKLPQGLVQAAEIAGLVISDKIQGDSLQVNIERGRVIVEGRAPD